MFLTFSGHRRALAPRNGSSSGDTNPKPRVDISISNKENVPPSAQLNEEAVDPSLKRLETLRCEEALRDKSLMLDSAIKEILNRGEAQKQLELELDRLYRLNQINLACMVITISFDHFQSHSKQICQYISVATADDISSSITERQGRREEDENEQGKTS